MEAQLPQNSEAEAAVLGSILIDPAALVRVVDLLTPEDFYHTHHRTIFRAILDVNAAGDPPDLVTLTDVLHGTGRLDDLGGVAALSSLANQVPSSRNIEQYAAIVHRCATLRALIDASAQIAGVAYHSSDAEAACDLALSQVSKVMRRSQKRRLRTFSQVMDELEEDVLRRIDADEFVGVQTGFRDIDAHFLGFEPGELIYLCARPGAGKSALGLAIAAKVAEECARRGHGSVAHFTLEMTPKAQARRLVSGRAEINTRFVRAGFRGPGNIVDLDEYARWAAAGREYRQLLGDRFLFAGGILSMTQLRADIQRAVMDNHCRLVVLDQLDLMADKGKDEFQRITQMSRELKQIAQSLGVVVLCLVQLNREVEKRANKRPMLADLRQSGQLEQDADAVLAIYRGAYYEADKADPKSSTYDPHFAQFAEILVLKARDGASGGTIPLQYVQEYARFSDWPFAEMPADPTRGSKQEYKPE